MEVLGMQSFHAVPLSEMVSSIAQWPRQWLGGALARQSTALRKLSTLVEHPTPDAASGFALALWDLRSTAAAAPFDLVRSEYAVGVQCGVIERSILASAAFERGLGAFERLTLGPFARSV
jgi:hypothetical protein